jgi:hypothetical protein
MHGYFILHIRTIQVCVVLVIRQEQIDRLFSERLEESVVSYAAYFRATVPELTRDLDEESVHGRLQAGIRDARAYGVEAAPALTLYLLLCVVLGPAFCREPQVDRFLRYPGFEPAFKLDMLVAEFARRIAGGEPTDGRSGPEEHGPN